MFKFIFYVPKSDVEKVKSEVFKTGAGSLGHYRCCAWETLGVGQFKPLKGARPMLGSVDQLERVEELRVEILCTQDTVEQAVFAMKRAHPYEEPAYEVLKLENY